MTTEEYVAFLVDYYSKKFSDPRELYRCRKGIQKRFNEYVNMKTEGIGDSIARIHVLKTLSDHLDAIDIVNRMLLKKNTKQLLDWFKRHIFFKRE